MEGHLDLRNGLLMVLSLSFTPEPTVKNLYIYCNVPMIIPSERILI
jgi:hypothetical protein